MYRKPFFLCRRLIYWLVAMMKRQARVFIMVLARTRTLSPYALCSYIALYIIAFCVHTPQYVHNILRSRALAVWRRHTPSQYDDVLLSLSVAREPIIWGISLTRLLSFRPVSLGMNDLTILCVQSQFDMPLARGCELIVLPKVVGDRTAICAY